MKFVEPLSEDQGEELEALRRTGATHRQRSRAHAVPLSAQGYAIAELATSFPALRQSVVDVLARVGSDYRVSFA